MTKKFSIAELTADPPRLRAARQRRLSHRRAIKAIRQPEAMYALGAGTLGMIELLHLLAR